MATYKLTHTGQQLDAAITKVENDYADVSGVTATADKVLVPYYIVDANKELVAGSMQNRGSISYTVQPGERYVVPEGYHDGSGVVLGAALPALTNPSSESDTLSGKDFINQSGQRSVGTMPNNGSINVSLAPGNSYTIPRGFHSGEGRISVTGGGSNTPSLPTLTNPGNAVDMRADRDFIDQSGNRVTGTMPDNGVINASIDGLTFEIYSIPQGYTDGGTVRLTNDIENWLASI